MRFLLSILLAAAVLAGCSATTYRVDQNTLQLSQQVVELETARCVDDYTVVAFGLQKKKKLPTYVSVPSCETHQLRYVVDASFAKDGSATLETRPAWLSEVAAKLSLVQEHFCAGFNTKDCQTAATQFPMFTSDIFSAACSNCFVGLGGNFVLDLDMGSKYFSIGFQNLTMDWAAVVSAHAQKSWSFAYDKTFINTQFDIVNTKIGPVPIHVYGQLTVPLTTALSVNGAAQASLGVQSVGNLGSLMAIYQNGQWSNVYPAPEFASSVVKTFSYDAQADGQASLQPSLSIFVDNVFQGKLAFTPSLTMHAQSSGGSACANASDELKLEFSGTVDFDWFHYDKSFDKVLFDQTYTIVHTC